MKRLLLIGTAMAAVVAAPASAATTFVGSWTVDQGPSWTVVPAAYTGQEAAALLFGGSAAEYAISTIDSSISNIDHLSWVSVWSAGSFDDCPGFPCGRKVAEDFKTSTGGLYENEGDTSAYVNDWAVGRQFTNYAFRVDSAGVPEPATWAMMIGGFGMVGGAMRYRKGRQAVRFA